MSAREDLDRWLQETDWVDDVDVSVDAARCLPEPLEWPSTEPGTGEDTLQWFRLVFGVSDTDATFTEAFSALTEAFSPVLNIRRTEHSDHRPPPSRRSQLPSAQ